MNLPSDLDVLKWLAVLEDYTSSDLARASAKANLLVAFARARAQLLGEDEHAAAVAAIQQAKAKRAALWVVEGGVT